MNIRTIKVLACLFLPFLLSACIRGEVVGFNNDCPKDHRQICVDEALIELCTQTVNRYAYSRDRLLYDKYGRLFSEDASFQLGSQPVTQGREAIVEALRKRGPLVPTRHFSQVVDMQVLSDKSVKGLSYVTVYKYPQSGSATELETSLGSGTTAHRTKGLGTIGPWIVAEYHDTFSVVSGQCLIESRRVEIISKTD